MSFTITPPQKPAFLVRNLLVWLLWSLGQNAHAQGWHNTGSLNTGRAYPSAISLLNGKVLAISGVDSTSAALASCELYDPSTGSWSYTGSLTYARGILHSSVRLANGEVLVVGGAQSTSSFSDEIYDPSSGLWRNTGAMNVERIACTLTLLPSGKVLATGGYTFESGSPFEPSSELFDPNTETWSYTGTPNQPRVGHTATLLSNGKVLVVGGYSESLDVLSVAELFDPSTGTWSTTGANLYGRAYHTATVLQNGKVFVAGGIDETNGSVSTAEVYDPATATWGATGSQQNGWTNSESNAEPLPDGNVLLIAGASSISFLPSNSAALFNPVSGSWATANNLNHARSHFASAELLSGQIISLGGYSSMGINSSAEIYDACLGTASLMASASKVCLGYGPQTAVITASATGGYNFNYAWTGAGISGSGASVIFTPVAQGSYTIGCTATNEFGCQKQSSIVICVLDVRDPNHSNKVLLCHIPQGNSGNPRTLSLDPSSIAAHLTNHSGDKLGGCSMLCSNAARMMSGADEIIEEDGLTVTALPNPFQQEFTLKYSSNGQETSIEIYDVTGKLVETKKLSGYNGQLLLGAGLAPGLYYIHFTQADTNVVLKIVKIE